MKRAEKRSFGFIAFLKGFFSFRDKNSKPGTDPVHKKLPTYNPEKQKEIEMLCNNLFRQKSLVTSGKLQLIGLEKVKRRMGPGWVGLQPLVYQIVEDVITRYMAKGDIFLRYQDDKYVILFESASREEGEMKAMLMAEEIKNNIFAMNKEELKGFDVEKHVSEVETAPLLDKPLHEMVGHLASKETGAKKQGGREDFTPLVIKPIQVGADYSGIPEPVIMREQQWSATKKMACTYTPLWDVQKSALTTYLCRATQALADKIFFSKDAQDMAVLETVIAELHQMNQEEKKFFIICPVHHETLYHNGNFKKFTSLCQHMTPEQKKFLILMIVDPLENLPKRNAYWFVPPLKGCCNSVFIEVPIKEKTDFFYLHQCGFDAMGISLEKMYVGEPARINTMNTFSSQARAFLMPKIFVLDISTLSLATSAACAGFSYLGGAAIHEDVPVPDKMYRYKHEDLLSGLVSKK